MPSSRFLSVKDENGDRHHVSASRAYFHAIVTRSADGVLVLDEEGVICYANPAAQQILGRSLESLLGSVFGIPCVPGESIEIDVVRQAGETRVAELRVSATTWQQRPAHLAMIRDVTERRRSEFRALEDVQRRDEFMAMLSHELRNPIATIAKASRVASRSLEADPARTAEALGIVERQCGLVRRLLDDLLDVSRFTCGKIVLRREPVLLQRIVEDAVETLADPVGEHALVIAMPPEPIHVDGDASRLVQVVVNLLSNAFKYSPRGGRIEVRLAAEGADCRLEVRDDGCGIPADQLESIFRPFVQLESSSDHAEPGLGMGLPLVQMIVERHGGDVGVHSDGPGRGTTFVVRLPLVESVFAKPPATPRVETGARVLVVEDNDDLRDMMAAILELEGHSVFVAESGTRALEFVEGGSFDAALVDIGMPGMDGYELARRFRRRPDLDRTRLVAITGYGMPDDVRRALEAGFDHHLVKPIELDVLGQILALGPRHAQA